MQDVRAKVSALRPKTPRKISMSLKVKPRSDHYGLVGTAFDYLLRFELQRRAPHAVAKRWVAEYAPDIIWRESGNGTTSYLSLAKDDKGVVYISSTPMEKDAEELAKEVAEHARNVVEKAKLAVAAYVKSELPTRPAQVHIASHAIRLAKLDTVYRALKLDPSFDEADQEDIEDLLDMLVIVPFNSLIHSNLLLLNPTFGRSSKLVGGADVDLITGDMLVDFKTTKRNEIVASNLDQLLGYFFLAHNQRRMDSRFPQIKRLALYFCRHGYLWVVDTATVTAQPEFQEIERWFFKRAEEVFGASSATLKTGNHH